MPRYPWCTPATRQRDHPAWREWNIIVAALWFDLHAVKKSLGAFTPVIVLNAPFSDLPVGGGKDFLLHPPHFLLHVFAAPEQIETGPCEQTRNRIEVGTEGLAANTSRFKWYGATAAETVTDAGRVAKSALAELFDKFG